jgi:hypothetical protein
MDKTPSKGLAAKVNLNSEIDRFGLIVRVGCHRAGPSAIFAGPAGCELDSKTNFKQSALG